MKLRQFFPLVLFCAISCTPKVIPLKNSYDDKPFEMTAGKDFEQVWSNTIEFFAKSGISIKIIDKSSGLIVATATQADVTAEDKNGKLINPDAWAVAEKIYEPGSNRTYYAKVGTIEWNVFLKKATETSTTVNINLISVVTITVAQAGFATPIAKTFKTRSRTTGVWEKTVFEKIK